MWFLTTEPADTDYLGAYVIHRASVGGPRQRRGGPSSMELLAQWN
jgi:hypothetical protein